jgi:hypothetical protein
MIVLRLNALYTQVLAFLSPLYQQNYNLSPSGSGGNFTSNQADSANFKRAPGHFLGAQVVVRSAQIAGKLTL